MKNVIVNPHEGALSSFRMKMEDRFGLPSQDCCNVKAPPVGVDVTVLRDFGDAANATKTIPAGKYTVGVMEGGNLSHHMAMTSEEGEVVRMCVGYAAFPMFGQDAICVNWMDEEVFTF